MQLVSTSKLVTVCGRFSPCYVNRTSKPTTAKRFYKVVQIGKSISSSRLIHSELKNQLSLLTQFKTYIKVNNELISLVKIGDNFIFLQKSFSFDMNNADIKAELVTDLNNILIS